MKKIRGIIGCIALTGLSVLACSGFKWRLEYPKSFIVSIRNDAVVDRTDAVISLTIREIEASYPDFNPEAFIVLSGRKETASQADDLDGDGKADTIFLIKDVEAGEGGNVTVRYAADGVIQRTYPKRTQAELSHKFGGRFVNRKYEGGEFRNVTSLRVPSEHTDHSTFIRYEGPGWESDRVGYRFYLDWRNAVDIFGKKVSDMVLQDVGLDGFDSYHEMAGWGMDILKVGESLGVGSLGMWIDGRAERVSVTDSVLCAVVSDGPIRSQIRTRYYGWKTGSGKYDLVSDLSITAGSRMTRHDVRVNGDPPNLCTGIVKLDDTQFMSTSRPAGVWMALATYGMQSLSGDKLGMAVLFRRTDLVEVTEDAHSHVIVLKPKEGILTYYYLAAWEQEPGGIQSEKAFLDYLNETVQKLDAPLKVTL